MVITITNSRLHQVAAAGDLPPAAPRRRRRDRDGHEGRGLHRAPLRVLDPRLPAVLHQPRQGLPLEGLRAARGARARPRAATSATSCRCARASGCSPCSRRATSPRRSTSCSRPARASSRRPSSAPTTRRSRPTASSRSTSATTTSSSPCAASRRATTSSWSPAPARPRASRRPRCARWAATRAACAGMNVAQAGNACSRWTSPATTRSCSSSPRTASASARAIDEYPVKGRGAMGVKTIKLTEAQGRPRRRARRPRARGARVHLAQRHGPAHLGARHQPLRPRRRRACG